MDLISTHVAADFDALASMLAASKLYPQARLVFPGRRNGTSASSWRRRPFPWPSNGCAAFPWIG